MSLSGRIEKEKKQLKKDLEAMQDTLQRLKAYSPQVIGAIDIQLEAFIVKLNLHDNLRRKLGEARSSLQNAKINGSKLLGATDREKLLNLTLSHCKKAAASLGSAASML